MLFSQLSVFGCLAGFSVILHCSAAVKTTVILMRHCFRATKDTGITGNSSYLYFDDYTAKSWESFSVPAMHCLPRGKKIVEAQGRWISSQSGWLPLPLRAIADNVPDGQRDNVTMEHLLKGLALDPTTVSSKIDHAHFDKGDSASCQAVKPSAADIKTSMQEFMDANPPSPSFARKMQKLYDLTGAGVAGNWTGIPCTSETEESSATAIGNCNVASKMVERLLMELGAGSEMTLGWGKVTPEDVADLLELHAWQFHILKACPCIYKWTYASIITSILSSLLEGQPGTTLYVGHDDGIMSTGGALGLSWDASPYPIDSTLPASMLRFDRDGDTITASYHFVSDYTADVTGPMPMIRVPANFGTSGPQVSMATFQDLVKKGTFASCAKWNTSQDPLIVSSGIAVVPSALMLLVIMVTLLGA